MHTIGVAVEHLKLLGVEPSFFHELGSTEAVLEGGAGIEIAHARLNEGTQVSRGSVGEFHDPAGLSLEVDDVATANIGCLHGRGSRHGRSDRGTVLLRPGKV